MHGLRLAVDANLSSAYRKLTEQDVHSGVTIADPIQVLVSCEFRGYDADAVDINEYALLGPCEVEPGLARITYRFRPRASVREQLESGERKSGTLKLADYHFEVGGGGANDPATVTWNEEAGTSIRFGDLQAFLVEYLPAQRDARQILRQGNNSPLGRLIEAHDIPLDERDKLVDLVKGANDSIGASPTISAVGDSLESTFCSTAGEAFDMAVKLGMTEVSFASISRAMTVLLSNDALTSFSPGRNGLGLNNILYLSMLLDLFDRRVGSVDAAGQLLLIEEPEAHLHPQLQRVVYDSLSAKNVQVILSSHSTHITSHAPLKSFVALTNDGTSATASAVPANAPGLTDKEVADLERFLDATRSSLLFARKVLLVEGPAEVFLIPPLVKHVMKVDLNRNGVAVVAIHGTHFAPYAKLFGPKALSKRCAIVGDADLKLGCAELEIADGSDRESIWWTTQKSDAMDNEFVKSFLCGTTFERAVTLPGTMEMLADACEELSKVKAEAALRKAQAAMTGAKGMDLGSAFLSPLRDPVLSAAQAVGKARFAQVASKHVNKATELPAYIYQAVAWLLDLK